MVEPLTVALYLGYLWKIIIYWWWFPLPFLLIKPTIFLWHYWKREEWNKKQKRILLEIKMPKEVLKPIRAMETVMTGSWQILYAPPNWYENWIDGQVPLSYQLEIVSLGGEPHFYIRTVERLRDAVEANFYSQYPEAEISIAEDYTKYVPQDIPNKDWDLWGADYKLLRPDPYPILTYKKFETESEPLEEKRVDPVAGLLESMAKIKPGEQLWIQIAICSIGEDTLTPFIDQAKALRDKLAKRTVAPPQRPIIEEAAKIIITGEPTVEEKKEEFMPPEMKLTPGEKEIVAAVEEKMAKPCFMCHIRFIYLGQKEVYFKPNFRLGFNFFAYFFSQNCNALIPLGTTLTKIKQDWYNFFFFIKRRLYLRKRKIFRQYRERYPPFFPNPGGTFVLNVEEVASLFHFPSEAVAPTPSVPRVEAKKGGPPIGLPVEED